MKKNDRPFFIFLAALGVVRLSLLGIGAASLGDEFRYWFSARMLLAASHGDLAGAIGPMFDTAGRPGLALVNLPAIGVQSVLFKIWGLDPRCPVSLVVPQVFGVFWSLAVSFFFYNLGRKLAFLSPLESLFCTILFSLLVGSNLYVRHLLPYDQALAFFLFTLYLFLEKKNLILIGILTAFSFSIYPGFWPLCLVIGALILYDKNQDSLTKTSFWKPVFNAFLKTGLGFFSVLVFYEILAQLSGKSYLKDSFLASNDFLNYLHLNYDGSGTFLADYLWSVEGFVGVFIGLGSLIFLGKTFYKLVKKRPISQLEMIGLALLAAFIFQAAAGWFSGMKTFYARLFRADLPFMIWAAWLVFRSFFEKWRVEKVVVAVVLSLSVVHFARFYHDFAALGYPRDVLFARNKVQSADGLGYDIQTFEPPKDGLRRVFEFEPRAFFTKPPASTISLIPNITAENKGFVDTSLVFLNFSAVPVLPRGHFQPFSPPDGSDWWVRKPHFSGFEPYWFDESPSAKRTFFHGEKLWLGVVP